MQGADRDQHDRGDRIEHARGVIEARFHDRIADLPASAWDALRPDDNPFLAHAFLHALERDGCIREDWGWRPHHLGLYEHDKLIAAAPVYLKANSHGEFVFDWSWASAWERAGGDYYPKLLGAVPYSPVPGPRLIAGADARTPMLQRALVEALRNETDQHGLSSAHVNFLPAEEAAAFDDENWLARFDVQFHWHNAGYADFESFLAALNHKKRKNIRRQRAEVAASGLSVEMRDGASLSADEWRTVHALYLATFEAKGNHAALTARFFAHLADLGDTVQLALARDRGRIVAMALFLRSRRVLYGRYWGSTVDLPGLHFELCYYQGIDYAIAHGLERFEPGAQGEHKLARGFLPARTHSRHYLADARLRDAVRASLSREARALETYIDECLAHSPYAQR